MMNDMACHAEPKRQETAAESILRSLNALREAIMDLNATAAQRLQPLVINHPSGPEGNTKELVDREFPAYFNELRGIINETRKFAIDTRNIIDRVDV